MRKVEGGGGKLPDCALAARHAARVSASRVMVCYPETSSG
jgi:hypothetical protein